MIPRERAGFMSRYYTSVTKRLPQRVRNWLPKHGVQSDAHEVTPGVWSIGRVRDFTYARDGGASEVWLEDQVMNTHSIERAWLLLEPFTTWRAVAHPYFVFAHTDGTATCFTIEGKRLVGAPYSGLKGLMNEYELGYIWMTERDCLTMPLTHGAQALYLYPLTLSAESAQKLACEFLRATHALFEKPEFYNTLFNNCTGRFAHTLRRIGVRAPHDVSWYLPGYIDSYLQRMGLIVGSRSNERDLVQRADEVWRIIESSQNSHAVQLMAKQLDLR